ncbi:hypothetical protein GQ53DRAFT_743195 [Thozetella sp. PMI_491]|nr:hypothetical protein GQ53DRAFT_743195 [Thozetella sp. PMI_491]
MPRGLVLASAEKRGEGTGGGAPRALTVCSQYNYRYCTYLVCLPLSLPSLLLLRWVPLQQKGALRGMRQEEQRQTR